MSEASPQWGVGWRNFVLLHMPTCVCIYICMCVCVPYAHNPESAWKILWPRLPIHGALILFKREVCPCRRQPRKWPLGKLAVDTLDLSMMMKTAADSKAKGKKRGSTIQVACLVTCCQGKDAGDLFRLNYSIN